MVNKGKSVTTPLDCNVQVFRKKEKYTFCSPTNCTYETRPTSHYDFKFQILRLYLCKTILYYNKPNLLYLITIHTLHVGLTPNI